LSCAISGEVPEVPVISPASGSVFEKRLIEKHLVDNDTDPINGEPLSADQLIAVSTGKIVKPRPPTANSIPALIKLFQDEWDSTMLETFKLREHVQQIRQELSHALYQHDAACRVIARLTRERDQARQALATLQPTSAPVSSVQAAPATMTMEVDPNEEDGADDGMTPAIIESLVEHSKVLSKGRKANKKKALEGLASADEIKGFEAKSSATGIHNASPAGILALSIGGGGGGKVLTGGADKTARLYDMASETVTATMKGHKKKVSSVILHPTADVAVTGSADKTVCIWEASTGKKQHTLKTHSADVTGVSLQPTGDYFISTSDDRHYAFSSIESGQTLAYGTDADIVSGISSCQFHPDGLFFGTGTTDGVVHIWDIQDQQKKAVFEGHKGKINSLCFSENGYHLATASEDSTVKLWDLRNLKEFHTMEFEAGFKPGAVTFDQSGKYLAVGGSDIRTYAVKGFVHLNTMTDHAKAVTALAFGPNAKSIYSTSMDRALKVFA